MSWQLLDGPSRRPRLNWAVPEHLRDDSRYGPFRRVAVLAPLDPDALLQYMDNAISIMENAQATRQLPLLFASASSSSSSPSSSSPLSSASELTSSSPSVVAASSSASSSSLSSSSQLLAGDLPDVGSSILVPAPSGRRVSRFKSVPLQQKYIKSPPNDMDREEATKLNPLIVSKTKEKEPIAEQGSSKTDASSPRLLVDNSESEQAEDETFLEVDQMSDTGGEEYDARAADEAYRVACCALSEGDAELALSHLHVALDKCPPHKQNALGKVRRLMAATMQLVEKNSAVLRPLLEDKDAQ